MNDLRYLLSVKRQIIICLKPAGRIVIPLGLLAFAACSSNSEPPPQEAIPVVIGSVASKNLPFEIKVIGNVEAYTTVEVRSRVGGELRQVYFTEGQDVRKGDPLFLIDPGPYKAALEMAKANLARNTALARNAEENVQRYGELVKKDYITQQQYSDMLANAQAQKAAMEADRAAVENARLDLDYCSLASPIDGRTGSLLVHQGNLIKANAENPMVVIHQIQPVYVGFTVPEQFLSEIVKYSSASKLQVKAHAPGEEQSPHMGELNFIDNTVDASTGTILLKAVFQNEDEALWPGEFVNVELVLKMLENAVTVPAQAVQSGQEGDYIFVVKSDMTVQSQPVTVSYRIGSDAVVENGLKPGEKVVVDGQLRLYPGAKVVETTALNNGKASNQ
ncbi:MAG TPA: efflux RND transporter periplasmic adaptor subunit [archaeon]|nr:efflux RND transporter periplasmic adaptor subunit [archaeon]